MQTFDKQYLLLVNLVVYSKHKDCVWNKLNLSLISFHGAGVQINANKNAQ